MVLTTILYSSFKMRARLQKWAVSGDYQWTKNGMLITLGNGNHLGFGEI